MASTVIDLTGDDGDGVEIPQKTGTKRTIIEIDDEPDLEHCMPALKHARPAAPSSQGRSPLANVSNTYPASPRKTPTRQHPPAPPAVLPAQPPRAPEYKCYAVRVGWFPGIYEVKNHCRMLTKNYPLQEHDRFESLEAARAYLDEGSPNAAVDAQNRPANFRNVDRDGWTHYLERTWVARDAEPAPTDKREIIKKLRKLFLEACDCDGEVDWGQHPLPQQLIRRDQQCDFANISGLDDHYIRMREQYNPSASICSCGNPAPPGNDVVSCANPNCAILNYHRACVGLANRRITPGWRCRHCRPTMLPPSQPSQAPPPYSTQAPIDGQYPSEPPPPYESQNPLARPASTAPFLIASTEPDLHPEQQKVVDCIMSGQNVFYTGSAGTGKSTVLKKAVEQIKALGKHVDIIAPSGIAALNVGGMTLYSYAGWHPDSFKEPVHKLAEKAHAKTVHKRLCNTDVLVIDEISMVERDILERLDVVMRAARAAYTRERDEKTGKFKPDRSQHTPKKPFGGVQVIVTGDFCQLPPVLPHSYCIHCGGEKLPGIVVKGVINVHCPRCDRTYLDTDKWAFRAPVWQGCEFKCFELRTIHRQNDLRFIEILQRCRFGRPFTAADRQLLLQDKADPSGAVKLTPLRQEVLRENKREFDALRPAPVSFDCKDVFKWRSPDQPELKRYARVRYGDRPNGPLDALKEHRFDEHIDLKVGMLVILLVNLDFDRGLVNGSQGRIIGYEKHDENKVMLSLFPNSYGRDGSNSGDNARLNAIQALRQAQVKEFIAQANVKQWPVVQFHNGVTHPIYAQCQCQELGLEEPYSLLARTQIPLLAAWAITVHKSQGMTLNRVIVDLHSSFEKEMVYVALSRARNLEGLKVLRLPAKEQNRINGDVHAFLKENGLLAAEDGARSQGSVY